MTTEASRRLHLYETTRQGWGPEAADTLMELLPPEPDSLATKADLALTKADLRIEIAEVRTEIAELRAEVHRMFAEQTRTLLLANVGMWFTTVSLSFAVAKLA